MGLPIARNLARAGIAVRAWNRTAQRAAPLRDEGAVLLDTPAEAASGASVLITMLSDADAVHATMTGEDGALSTAAPQTIWWQMSTIGESSTERFARLADAHHLAFVDAPVLGADKPAEEAKLVVLGSGPSELRERLQPLFDAISHRTIWAGEVGAGSLLKLVANSWVLAVTEACAEVVAFSEGTGIDPALFLDAVQGGALDLQYLQQKAKAMMSRDFAPSFRLTLAAKDARLIGESSAKRSLDLPLFETVAARMRQGVAEHGEEDFSATYWSSAPQAGGGAS